MPIMNPNFREVRGTILTRASLYSQAWRHSMTMSPGFPLYQRASAYSWRIYRIARLASVVHSRIKCTSVPTFSPVLIPTFCPILFHLYFTLLPSLLFPSLVFLTTRYDHEEKDIAVTAIKINFPPLPHFYAMSSPSLGPLIAFSFSLQS